MDISQKALRRTFALAALGLYAFGLGATVGARSYDYVRTIGDYKVNRASNVHAVIVDNPNTQIIPSLFQFDQPDFAVFRVRNNASSIINPVVTPLTYVSDEATTTYGYHVRIGTYYWTDTGYLNIITNVGTIPLKFEYTYDVNGDIYTYHFNLTYNSDNVYYSNIYLDNFKIIYNTDESDTYVEWPSVFFNGDNEIMQGNLSFDWDDGGLSTTLPLSYVFDVKIIPSSMVDILSAFNNGREQGYAIGYDDGKNYVLGHSDEFNLYSYAQYLAYGQSRYNQGLNDGQNTLSMSGVMETIFTAPIKMFMQIFNSSAWRWTMPTGEVLDLGGLMTFFLTIGIALAVVRLIMKVGGK